MIKVYTGPMFSGKSAGLINSYMRIWNKHSVICFKPKEDSRDEGIIKSRDFEESIPAICINDLAEIKNNITENIRTIFIDEAQFLTGDVNELIQLSIDGDIDIHIAGLDQTAEQKPFGIIGDLLAIADNVEKYQAVCYFCNKPASYTYYDGEKDMDVLVGNDGYMPLCPKCLSLKRKAKK